jgi:lipopolysaccharide export system ATP-binding protein
MSNTANPGDKKTVTDENASADARDATDTLWTVKLTKIYDNIPVVNQIEIGIKSGEVIGLLGRNGAGKTTTFLMLSGIIKPDGGQVMFNDDNINHLPSHLRAERGLVYLPQQHSVFLKASAFDNLYMVLQLYFKKKEARRRTLELLEDFGLAALHNSIAYQLSGGEKRRLEIARAMIMKPKFLFLDEPFTGIDPITILEIQKIILKLKERGIGIIITDHNVKDTFDITDRVYIIQKGQILSTGHPSWVVLEEKTRQLFLGDDFHWQSR